MGITILAILGGASGVVNAVVGILLFTVATTIFGLSGAIFGLAVIAIATLSLAFAVGAIQMQPWAWPLGMVLALAGIAVAAVLILGGSNVSGISLPLNVLAVVLYGAIAYYLNQGSIKALFGR